jgi:hypothetical protein
MALVRQDTVELDFLADGGFVFPQCFGNGGFGQAVLDPLADDTAFFERKVQVVIRISHRDSAFLGITGKVIYVVAQNSTLSSGISPMTKFYLFLVKVEFNFSL